MFFKFGLYKRPEFCFLLVAGLFYFFSTISSVGFLASCLIVPIILFFNYKYLEWGMRYIETRLSQSKLCPKREVLFSSILLLPFLVLFVWKEIFTLFFFTLLFFFWLLFQVYFHRLGNFYTAFIGITLSYLINLSYFFIWIGKEIFLFFRA